MSPIFTPGLFADIVFFSRITFDSRLVISSIRVWLLVKEDERIVLCEVIVVPFILEQSDRTILVFFDYEECRPCCQFSICQIHISFIRIEQFHYIRIEGYRILYRRRSDDVAVCIDILEVVRDVLVLV